jgi:hypothetical protein
MFHQPDLWDQTIQTIATSRPCPCCQGSGTIMSDQPIRAATARFTDPSTSHQAADQSPDVRRFGIKSRTAQVLRAIFAHPATQLQTALAVMGSDSVSRLEGTRRRVSQLVQAGYITDSGRRSINPGSDVEAIVWVVTEDGRRALERLDETGWS